MKRIVVAMAVTSLGLSLLAGCGIISGPKGPPNKLTGERIAVLSGETSSEIDPALADVPVVLPAAVANSEWTQPGGNAAKSMGHLAFAQAPSLIWSVNAGPGSSVRGRLGGAPIFAAGRVYTMDTQAIVRAFNPANGALLWQRQIGGQQATAQTLFGGGISFDNGRIYGTNGSGYAGALDAATGNPIWQVRPGGPLRGAPTIANDNVYVISQDNQLYALNPANGQTRWSGSGSIEVAGVFGTAAPAAGQGTVIAGFSSGELNAYRYENGRVVWQDALASTRVSTSVAALSDIDADPVIDQGRVYAVGQGGRMVALELNTGQRIWEVNIAGTSRPWVAGDWVFVVTDQARLLAIARSSGRIRWMTQLPRYRNPEGRSGPIHWKGPILAGNRLVLVNSAGQIVNVSPANGLILSGSNVAASFSLAPIVANNTLYALDDSGRLTAWR